ncbi:hypothetical protein ACIRVK_13665 [Streptomyces sp. NPDC101152]|uniref:hypothetical protein n=1 Tax=Streptomyces sp. NPDC101152 TaxID=3366116 RepID=UPI003817579C
MAAPLQEKLAEARKEAQALRERLEGAEFELNKALEAKDYVTADRHKKAADEVREPLLVADAHVKALLAGVQELDQHRQAEQRAAQERQRREQAQRQFEEASAVEAEAMDEMDARIAEARAAYAALRQTMADAMAAQQRAGQARLEAHDWGKAAGYWAPDAARPALPNRATVLVEHNQVLSLVWRTPDLPA